MVEGALDVVKAQLPSIEIDAPMGRVIVEMRRFEHLVGGEVVWIVS